MDYEEAARPPPGLALPALQRQYRLRDGDCVACNGCVDVCPENLIRLVASVADDLHRRHSTAKDAGRAALIKDETTCIRCAMCASRCPTHAILMREFEFYRECVTVAARNPKVLYQ